MPAHCRGTPQRKGEQTSKVAVEWKAAAVEDFAISSPVGIGAHVPGNAPSIPTPPRCHSAKRLGSTSVAIHA